MKDFINKIKANLIFAFLRVYKSWVLKIVISITAGTAFYTLGYYLDSEWLTYTGLFFYGCFLLMFGILATIAYIINPIKWIIKHW